MISVKPGSLGNIYGPMWRGTGKADKFDQILNLVNGIKNDPQSRRLLVNAWDVGSLPSGKRLKDIVDGNALLPPCHYAFQIYVDNDDDIHLMSTQR